MTPDADRAWRLSGVLCGLVVAIDQGVKALVESRMTAAEHVDLVGPVGLTLAHNRGVAFGLASGGGVALIGLTVLALVFVTVLFARDPERPGIWLAVGLLVGGALGNLADRVRADAVTDYVDVLSWPPFNLADVAITLGVVVLALGYLRQEPR